MSTVRPIYREKRIKRGYGIRVSGGRNYRGSGMNKDQFDRIAELVEQEGTGMFSDLMNKVMGGITGPFAKKFGPAIFDKIIIPFFKKQLGRGLRLAGERGRGPRIMGQGVAKNRWISHVKRTRRLYPHLAFKEALIEASKTYRA